MNPNTPTNSNPQPTPPEPLSAQGGQAPQTGAAPVSDAFRVFVLAEVFVLLISRLGVVLIILAFLKLYVIKGAAFEDGLQAITSIIGLVAFATIYVWSTDFIIRYKTIKSTKSKSVGTFLAVYYAITIVVIPWLVSLINPLIEVDGESSADLKIGPVLIYLSAASVISVGLELILYNRLNKPNNATGANSERPIAKN